MKYIAIVLILIFCMSCTKIIDINLNTTNSKVVIEAELDTYSPSLCYVRLTKTVNFSDDNIYPNVSGAVVTISDNDGNSYTLTEKTKKDSAGYYTHPTLKGIEGKTYTLKVKFENNEYSAVSTIPKSVKLTAITFLPNFNNRGRDGNVNDTTYIISPIFNALATQQELYLLRTKIRDTLDSSSFVRRSTNLIKNGNMQPINTRMKILNNSKVDLYFSAINQEAYDYYYVLYIGRNQQTTPSNPTSNIKGNAIGYFSAHATTLYTTIAPKP